MKCFIITGVLGMIGYHMAKTLEMLYPDTYIIGIDSCSYKSDLFNHQRLALLKQNRYFIYHQADLCTNSWKNKLHNLDILGVIHLAAYPGVAQSVLFPEKTLYNNHYSLLNLLRYISEKHIDTPILYASTSSVYGSQQIQKTKESDPLNPLSPYAKSKLDNECLAEEYAHDFGIKLFGFRFFTVFGEINRQDMFLYKCLTSLYQKTPLKLYYNGEMMRDFLYVKDLTCILAKMLHRLNSQKPGTHDIFNIGKGQPSKTYDIIKILENLSGKKANISFIQDYPSHDPLITYCDNQKLLSVLPNTIFTPIEKALNNTLLWFDSNYKIKAIE